MPVCKNLTLSCRRRSATPVRRPSPPHALQQGTGSTLTTHPTNRVLRRIRPWKTVCPSPLWSSHTLSAVWAGRFSAGSYGYARLAFNRAFAVLVGMSEVLG